MALACNTNGNVYAGGYFSTMGGQARNNIAALDASSGAATASTLETGAGCFDPEQAAEFARQVEIAELKPVATR